MAGSASTRPIMDAGCRQFVRRRKRFIASERASREAGGSSDDRAAHGRSAPHPRPSTATRACPL